MVNVGRWRDGIWPVHQITVDWMRNRELHLERLFSYPRDLFFPAPKWTLMETFPRHVAPVLTPLRIARMQQQLARIQQERVRNLGAEVAQIEATENVQLNEEVIRTTSSRMAEGMVADLLAKRSSTLGQQFLDAIQQVVQLVGDVPAQAMDRLNVLMAECREMMDAGQEGDDTEGTR